LVSVKAVIILVGALAFILAGGVGIIASATDRLRFESQNVRQSLNPRGDKS